MFVNSCAFRLPCEVPGVRNPVMLEIWWPLVRHEKWLRKSRSVRKTLYWTHAVRRSRLIASLGIGVAVKLINYKLYRILCYWKNSTLELFMKSVKPITLKRSRLPILIRLMSLLWYQLCQPSKWKFNLLLDFKLNWLTKFNSSVL